MLAKALRNTPKSVLWSAHAHPTEMLLTTLNNLTFP